MGIMRTIVMAGLIGALAGAPAAAQVTLQPLLSQGSAGAGSPPRFDWRPRDIVIYGGKPSERQVLELQPGANPDAYPLNLGVSADVKLERGMAAVGYAFARLDPETAARVYRLKLGESNQNLGSRFVWLGEHGSAMKATLFLVDTATLISAKGTDQVERPAYMDLSLETKRILSDRIRLEAGLSKALFAGAGDKGEFNGFTSKINQGMTLQAGVGYVPLTNLSLNLESMYRANSTEAVDDSGRAINLSGEWVARDSVLLGAAFIYYDQEDSNLSYVGMPVEGQTIQFQAFFDLDSANNLVLGVSARHHGRPEQFGYSTLGRDPNQNTIFEVSISSDF
jgi:hypothetical protein